MRVLPVARGMVPTGALTLPPLFMQIDQFLLDSMRGYSEEEKQLLIAFLREEGKAVFAQRFKAEDAYSKKHGMKKRQDFPPEAYKKVRLPRIPAKVANLLFRYETTQTDDDENNEFI